VSPKGNLSFNRRFPYISVTGESSEMQLGFAKAYHQIPLEEKVSVALG